MKESDQGQAFESLDSSMIFIENNRPSPKTYYMKQDLGLPIFILTCRMTPGQLTVPKPACGFPCSTEPPYQQRIPE